MPRPIRHADLVARALDALPPGERARIDRALESDSDLRHRFEAIAGHLLGYDHLPPAPPPPPFERLAARMDAEERPDLGVLRLPRAAMRPARRRVRVWAAAAAAAALLLVALGVMRMAGERPAGERAAQTLVAGSGLEILREGRSLAAPASAALGVRPGDLLRCREAAEARLGDRVRLVLDGGGALRIEEPGAVTLESGRAWFEVAPGPFEVRTRYGPVRVLGTAFEVDLRSGSLGVAVAHGRVAAEGHVIAAGEHLAAGRIAPLSAPPGDWFGRPRLRLERLGDDAPRQGRPVELRLVFENPHQVPLRVPGPAGARTAVWLSFETPEGRVVGELPVLPANVIEGGALLRPGAALELAPGAQRRLTLRILPPVGSLRAYRCRALYRPAGRPGVLSTPLDIEVR